MKREVAAVSEFHQAFGVPVRPHGTYEIGADERDLRKALINEESQELAIALGQRDRVKMADGIVDTMYVVAGTAAQMGLNPEHSRNKAFAELMSHALGTTFAGLNTDDRVRINDGLAQIELLCRGLAAVEDMPYAELFREVHRSNMEKLVRPHDEDCAVLNNPCYAQAKCDCGAVIYRESDGKILKPEGWTPPDLEGVLCIVARREAMNGHYVHYKGGDYVVMGVGLREEDLQPVVIYQPRDIAKHMGPQGLALWTRPLRDFLGDVDSGDGATRFTGPAEPEFP